MKVDLICILMGSLLLSLWRWRHTFITHSFYIGELYHDSLEVQTYLYDTLYITNPFFGKGKSQKLVPDSFLRMAGLYDGVCGPKPSDLGLRFGKFLAWKLDIEHCQQQNFNKRTKSLSCDLQDSVQDKRKQNQDKCIKPICLNVVVVNWHYYYNYHYYYQYCVGIKVCMLIIYSWIRGTCKLRKILQITFYLKFQGYTNRVHLALF